MKKWLLVNREKVIIGFYVFIFSLVYVLAYELRFDFNVSQRHLILMVSSLPFIVISKLFLFKWFNLYEGWWRYVGMQDLANIIKASLLAALVMVAIGHFVFVEFRIPRSIPFIDFILTIAFVGGTRFSIRAYREGHLFNVPWGDKEDAERVLIIGAGNAGETLVREMTKHPEMKFKIVGFLDDSPYKQNLRIHGVKVLGAIDQVKDAALNYGVSQILIAIPTATGEKMRRIVGICEETGLKIKTIPGMDRLIDGRITFSQIRDVQIEDLLGREPIELDKDSIGLYLGRKKVLVTGAAGSIGSEMCRQVLAYGPEQLVLVDQSENGIFDMGQELISAPETDIKLYVADITDKERMQAIFKETRPDVVFHAAAYKHVPIMEDHPSEAINNNINGTRIIADLCEESGLVKRFVMISTDKAVNPTSVMGASKRIAERYVQHLSKNSKTKFITVRFGNVLGSVGSVIPIFKKQIAAGGPVTVTHPDMTRYFMTIPEASQLVLQAGAMGKGGEIFVLDMGKPVRILDLAKTLIKLSGFKVDEDIRIVFTGIRPGEKLFEELCLEHENISRTEHSKVYIRAFVDRFSDEFIDKIDNLISKANISTKAELISNIASLEPEYQFGATPGKCSDPPENAPSLDEFDVAASDED